MDEQRRITRLHRQEKLAESFIPHRFQQMLDAALEALQPQGMRLTFPIGEKNWVTHATIPIVYKWNCFIEHDEKEAILQVVVNGRVHVNGEPVGPAVLVRWTPYTGFIDLDKIIAAALESINDKIPEQVEQEPYLLADIEVDDNLPSTEAELLELAERLVEPLMTMGYKLKGATRLARQTVNQNPEVTDIDQLLELAMTKK
jgi:hypothetical protein